MNLVAITVIKNGCLARALAQLNWTQSELARRSGVTASVVSCLALMKHTPRPDVLTKIQRAFGQAGCFVSTEELWPEGFQGFGEALRRREFKDVDNGHLLQYYENSRMLLEDSNERKELIDSVNAFVPELSSEYQELVRLVLQGESYRRISRKMGYSDGWAEMALRRIAVELSARIIKDEDAHQTDTRVLLRKLRDRRRLLINPATSNTSRETSRAVAASTPAPSSKAPTPDQVLTTKAQ